MSHESSFHGKPFDRVFAEETLRYLETEQKKATETHGDTRWMNCEECRAIEDLQDEIERIKRQLARGADSEDR